MAPVQCTIEPPTDTLSSMGSALDVPSHGALARSGAPPDPPRVLLHQLAIETTVEARGSH
jgi:hypothetical protein